MIKFFRHIRQRYISEGKTGKYIKYAIGEIVLVVIGILIALQINNWNESRKIKLTWHTYTASLIKDLKQDTTTLNYITTYVKADSLYLDKLSKRLSKTNATTDTLKKIARYELTLSHKTYRPPNNKTFIAMQANGTLELFDDKTYAMLLNLQTLQGIAETIIKANNSAFLSQLSNLTSKYSMNEINAISGPLLDSAWQNTDTGDLFSRVEGYMATKNLVNKNNGKRYKELLKLTEKALNQLIEIQENQND